MRVLATIRPDVVGEIARIEATEDASFPVASKIEQMAGAYVRGMLAEPGEWRSGASSGLDVYSNVFSQLLMAIALRMTVESLVVEYPEHVDSVLAALRSEALGLSGGGADDLEEISISGAVHYLEGLVRMRDELCGVSCQDSGRPHAGSELSGPR